MPTKNEVLEEILKVKNFAQDDIRRQYLRELHELTGRDTIVYASAFTSKRLPDIPAFLVSVTPDDIQGFMSALHGMKGEKLDLILHSPGGSLEAADQIVQYLRSKYNHIRAIIPQNAMSAATMIACACNVILMGKHSAIGPIDPQITFPSQHGHFSAPAQAILDEFERAKNEVSNDPKTIPLWGTRIQSYPPGLLQWCQNTVELSVTKVTEWLSTYMFSHDPDAQEKAKSIAEWLGSTKEHKTHGRPIMASLAREKGLNVELLEENQDLQEAVLTLHHAVSVTMEITGCMKFVENHNGKGSYLNVNIEPKLA